MSAEKKRKQHERRTSNIRDWAGLHDYLLQEVLEKLPLADCLLSFDVVCKPWRSVAIRYLDKCDRVVPCLVKRSENKNQVTSRSCFSIFGNLNLMLDLPEARGSCVWGSFQDWLFLGRRDDDRLHISLLNPFSGENIVLPLAWSNYYLLVVSKVPSDEKCVFMLVGERASLAFWTPGVPDWHRTGILTSCIYDALYYRGCFYLLNDENRIFHVNEEKIISVITTGSRFFDARGVSSINYFSVELPISSEYRYGICRTRCYLVESCGEILLVSRIFCKDDPQIGITTNFDTYRLDLNKMAWLKLEKLEDQILFVGAGCSRSFHGGPLASNICFINEGAFSRFTEWNHPFKHENVDGDDDWGFFSLKKSNYWPSVFQARAKTFPAIWLCAPISWSLKQRRVII